jgi:hypothetical protein
MLSAPLHSRPIYHHGLASPVIALMLLISGDFFQDVLAEPEGQRIIAVDWSMYSIWCDAGETSAMPSDIPRGRSASRGVVVS